MRGNQRNLSGIFLRIAGDDVALSNFLDELNFVSGVQVLSHDDSGLALQLSAHALGRVTEIAGKLGLQVAG